jgi:carboxyl-terminal processing protease
MRRINKWIVLLVVVCFVGFAFRKPAEKYFDIAKSLDIYATLFKEVNSYYVDDVDPEKLVRHGIEGMLESLDPYTDYIAEDELETFRITTTGQYGGIGALIGVVNNKAVITHPYKGFPAQKAGIRVGDEIISVDGKRVQGKSTVYISSLLKGQPRTEVEVVVRRSRQKENITLKVRREKIVITNVAYAGMVAPDIGYIRLDDFTPGAGREVAQALSTLKGQGATKIVLDLRENLGGLLQEAVNVVNIFIPKGQDVVTTKGKVDDWNKSYKTLNQPVDTEIPLVVLVSEESASAAEIVAGAIQDYDRGVLIGKKTYGKGLVQTTRALAYNSQLKVTTAKYYIPSGRCIQAVDYTHRKDDGSVERVADSLKASFKTNSGRTVFDGGGLDPDVLMPDEYVGTVTAAVVNSGLVFEFATQYCAEKPQPSLKDFQLSDKEYAEFQDFLRAKEFRYTTSLERNAKQLSDAAQQERHIKELDASIKQLSDKINAVKATDFTRFKEEMTRVLEEQIGFHYALHEGLAAVSLDRDATVSESQKVLRDSARYAKILSASDGAPPKP